MQGVEMSQKFLCGIWDYGLNYKKFFFIWNIQQAHVSHSQDNCKNQRKTEAHSEHSKTSCFPGFRGLLKVLFSQKWYKSHSSCMNLPHICRFEELWIQSWPATITGNQKFMQNRWGSKQFWLISAVVSLHSEWKHTFLDCAWAIHLWVAENSYRNFWNKGNTFLPYLDWHCWYLPFWIMERSWQEAPFPVTWGLKDTFSMSSFPAQMILWCLAS